MGHILSKNDEWFLIQNNVDPITRKHFEKGDSVVVCKTCRCVQLEDCWNINGACANCRNTGFTTVFTKETVVQPVIRIPSKNKKKPTSTEPKNGTLFALGIVLPIIAILFYAFCFYYYYPYFPLTSSTATLVIGVFVSFLLGCFYVSMEKEPYFAAHGSYAGALMAIMSLFMGGALLIWWIINLIFTPEAYTIEYYLHKAVLIGLALANFITLRGFYLDLKRTMNSLMFKTLIAIVICAVIGYCAASYYIYGIVLPPWNSFPEDYTEDDYIFPEEDVVYDIPNDYEYMMPYADTMVYSWDSLEGMDADEVQFAINEIYAREGRIYLEEPYSSYFEGCSWYYGLYTIDEFDDSLLNDYERDNVELLVDYAKSKGYR